MAHVDAGLVSLHDVAAIGLPRGSVLRELPRLIIAS